MKGSSILIKSITGQIYKITDLIQGKKIPLTEQDLKDYDMHAQSGVYKDINGSLIDITEFYANRNNIEFFTDSIEQPKSNSIYVDKEKQCISVYDEQKDEFITIGVGKMETFTPDNALTDDEIKQVLTMFQSVQINK